MVQHSLGPIGVHRADQSFGVDHRGRPLDRLEHRPGEQLALDDLGFGLHLLRDVAGDALGRDHATVLVHDRHHAVLGPDPGSVLVLHAHPHARARRLGLGIAQVQDRFLPVLRVESVQHQLGIGVELGRGEAGDLLGRRAHVLEGAVPHDAEAVDHVAPRSAR